MWAQLAGRVEEAERLARESYGSPARAGAPTPRGIYTAQLFAVRRDQGRLAELLEPIERLSREPGTVGVMWRRGAAARRCWRPATPERAARGL